MMITKNIKKHLGKREILKGITLSIKSGDIVRFFGKNGAGKTTTFKIILGVISPDEGDIYIDEENIPIQKSMKEPFMELHICLKNLSYSEN